MPKPQRKSVILDTCFLVTLYNDTYPLHAIAKQYYEYFIDNDIFMHIPAIVVEEYEIKEPIDAIEATGNFIIGMPYGRDDAKKAAEFKNKLSAVGRGSTSKDAVSNDIKLLAQATNNDITYFITTDETLKNHCEFLNTSGDSKTIPIFADNYDESIFNGGQLALGV
ncbi:type II toxin-antitoxin system VapC family toxin [Candidatus Saccharibacteria bacterium]|nr:type II toxin-antitoxin system VapC family toxin [Candidatus Saccharibacteria bacterium]